MKELSLNILDIAQNSLRAGATFLKIELDQRTHLLTIRITDNGCGMKPDFLARVADPFSTTRTTRPVGLGLPLLKMEAEMTGGRIQIESRHESMYSDHGTCVTAVFDTAHVDCPPMGDLVGSLLVLIQGLKDTDLLFVHTLPGTKVQLDTRQLRAELTDAVPLSEPEVLEWIREYLTEAYAAS